MKHTFIIQSNGYILSKMKNIKTEREPAGSFALNLCFEYLMT